MRLVARAEKNAAAPCLFAEKPHRTSRDDEAKSGLDVMIRDGSWTSVWNWDTLRGVLCDPDADPHETANLMQQAEWPEHISCMHKRT